jgi:hypothetical protein
MMNLLREASDHDTVRAKPIPGRVRELYPDLATISRDGLCIRRNEIIRALNAEVRQMSLVRQVMEIMAPLQERAAKFGPECIEILKEWDDRCEYWDQENIKKDVLAHNNEVEYREEVIQALVADGKARHVAVNLTNTPAKLKAEAKRLGV